MGSSRSSSQPLKKETPLTLAGCGVPKEKPMQHADSIGGANAQAVSFDVEQTARTLSKIAYWKDALRARIRDILDRFEEVGVHDHEFHSLLAEVNDFKRACTGQTP
jgi:hypothetical protein